MPWIGGSMMEWFEQAADCVQWIIPIAAVVGLLVGRFFENPSVRLRAEGTYFAVFFLVAAGTLRTFLVEDPSWFLHGGALGIMIVGGVIPSAASLSAIDDSPMYDSDVNMPLPTLGE